MTTTQDVVIQALEVHKAFGELDILKGVTLEVRRGEVERRKARRAGLTPAS